MNIVLNTAQTALSILPEQSAEKFRALVERRMDAHAVLKRRDAELQDAIEARNNRDRDRRRKLDGNAGAGPGARMTEEERLALDKPVAAAEAEVERRRKAYEVAVAAWRDFDFVSECEAWINEASRSGVRLKYVPPVLPKATANAAVDVEKLRRRLDEIEAEFAKAEFAPRPLSELKEALSAELDKLASAPSVRLTERAGSPVNLVEMLEGIRRADGKANADPFGLILWAIRPALEERLLALLGNADPTGALTDDKREELMGRLADERLSVERQIEAAIVAAEVAGLQIARRREADPRSILEIEIVSGRVGRDW